MKIWENSMLAYLVIIDYVWQNCKKHYAQKTIDQYASRNKNE